MALCVSSILLFCYRKTQGLLGIPPPGYDEDREKEYPVLYLQHGGGENETGWVWQGKVNTSWIT